jgi:putative copper resistance protein D
VSSTVLAPEAAPPKGGEPRAGLDLLPVVAALLTAVPVALVVGAASGAFEPVLLADAGPVVEFGLPVLRVLHDLAAALTVGLLLVAAFLTPEGRRSVRRATAARVAAGAALVWTACAGAGTVLSFADAAGVPPSAPGFWPDLAANAWPLELTRLLLTETVLALLVVAAACMARTRGALAWTFLLSLAALLPLGFAGHASGQEGHEQAMTALMIHLFGVTLWVGGLLAIVLLRPTLGGALPDTVRRFSPVALGSYVAVGASGVLFALLEADDLGDLTSPYWLVLWAKVGALVVLGAFGARQRRVVVARGVDRPGAFARLALTELAVMGAAIGLAVALSRTPTPEVADSGATGPALGLTGYPEPAAYQPSVWLTAWQPTWLFLIVALLAVGLYAAGVRRLHRRGDRWPVGPTVCWVLGWAVFVYATSGAPGVYGRVMFSMHMVMHMALMMAIPIFLVLAAPVTLALRALPARRDRTLGPREVVLAVVRSRWATIIANPVVAAVIFFASLVGFYWTDAFEWALTTHSGHALMVAHFMLTGYAFVWSLIGTDPGPRKWPAPLRLVVLFGTLAAHAFFGLALMQGNWLLAPGFFKTIALPWVPDLIADQQLGGSIAWGVGELPTLVLALLVTRDWLRSDSREAVRSDRRAERDGDAELSAYNARLQQLARRGADRRSR